MADPEPPPSLPAFLRCPTCVATGGRQNTNVFDICKFQEHYARAHFGAKRDRFRKFECKGCPATFVTEQAVLEHMTTSEKYTCRMPDERELPPNTSVEFPYRQLAVHEIDMIKLNKLLQATSEAFLFSLNNVKDIPENLHHLVPNLLPSGVNVTVPKCATEIQTDCVSKDAFGILDTVDQGVQVDVSSEVCGQMPLDLVSSPICSQGSYMRTQVVPSESYVSLTKHNSGGSDTVVMEDITMSIRSFDNSHVSVRDRSEQPSVRAERGFLKKGGSLDDNSSRKSLCTLRNSLDQLPVVSESEATKTDSSQIQSRSSPVTCGVTGIFSPTPANTTNPERERRPIRIRLGSNLNSNRWDQTPTTINATNKKELSLEKNHRTNGIVNVPSPVPSESTSVIRGSVLKTMEDMVDAVHLGTREAEPRWQEIVLKHYRKYSSQKQTDKTLIQRSRGSMYTKHLQPDEYFEVHELPLASQMSVSGTCNVQQLRENIAESLRLRSESLLTPRNQDESNSHATALSSSLEVIDAELAEERNEFLVRSARTDSEEESETPVIQLDDWSLSENDQVLNDFVETSIEQRPPTPVDPRARFATALSKLESNNPTKLAGGNFKGNNKISPGPPVKSRRTLSPPPKPRPANPYGHSGYIPVPPPMHVPSLPTAPKRFPDAHRVNSQSLPNGQAVTTSVGSRYMPVQPLSKPSSSSSLVVRLDSNNSGGTSRVVQQRKSRSPNRRSRSRSRVRRSRSRSREHRSRNRSPSRPRRGGRSRSRSRSKVHRSRSRSRSRVDRSRSRSRVSRAPSRSRSRSRSPRRRPWPHRGRSPSVSPSGPRAKRMRLPSELMELQELDAREFIPRRQMGRRPGGIGRDVDYSISPVRHRSRSLSSDNNNDGVRRGGKRKNSRPEALSPWRVEPAEVFLVKTVGYGQQRGGGGRRRNNKPRF